MSIMKLYVHGVFLIFTPELNVCSLYQILFMSLILDLSPESSVYVSSCALSFPSSWSVVSRDLSTTRLMSHDSSTYNGAAKIIQSPLNIPSYMHYLVTSLQLYRLYTTADLQRKRAWKRASEAIARGGRKWAQCGNLDSQLARHESTTMSDTVRQLLPYRSVSVLQNTTK